MPAGRDGESRGRRRGKKEEKEGGTIKVKIWTCVNLSRVQGAAAGNKHVIKATVHQAGQQHQQEDVCVDGSEPLRHQDASRGRRKDFCGHNYNADTGANDAFTMRFFSMRPQSLQ